MSDPAPRAVVPHDYDEYNGLDAYQVAALRTAGGDPLSAAMRACWALGLTGESGEYADLVKKQVYHAHPRDRTKEREELGDILWYLAVAAHSCGLTLSEVARLNLHKLRGRYPAGFDPERSLHRGPTR